MSEQQQWEVVYLPEALEDLRKMEGNQKNLVYKAIAKAQKNPLPADEGGYGRPLGNKRGVDLNGLLKIKLRGAGIRIVYQLIRYENQMLVVVIGAREDNEVYRLAAKRVPSTEN